MTAAVEAGGSEATEAAGSAGDEPPLLPHEIAGAGDVDTDTAATDTTEVLTTEADAIEAATAADVTPEVRKRKQWRTRYRF